MRIQTRTLIAAGVAVAILGSPAASRAQSDEQRLQAFEQRLMALEDKLSASEQTIERQQSLLEEYGARPDVAQGSGVDAFFKTLEIGGFVTSSYIYNSNNPDENTFSQTLCQFNCNHNEFSFDAAMLSIGRSASEPGTAGFQLDLLFGQNANILTALSPDGAGTGQIPGTGGLVTGSSDTNLFVQEGYVSYNYEGTLLKMGKFETLMGYEVLDSPYNPHVTHSTLFTFAIPLFHTGIVASGANVISSEIGMLTATIAVLLKLRRNM